MICPGLFETMREQLNRLRALRVPDQETGCRRAKSTDHPENVSHFRLTSSLLVPTRPQFDAGRQK
jgi:hypothetical protein